MKRIMSQYDFSSESVTDLLKKKKLPSRIRITQNSNSAISSRYTKLTFKTSIEANKTSKINAAAGILTDIVCKKKQKNKIAVATHIRGLDF
ncbi:hypothetical protein TNCT_588371 [Trichonephila clavata]|uniref:Uncharacterized protein n=1 Tax=Trichonephila clavata TaxID=2740835 RepID=A0A8X6IKK1_TRICU|nr:hypothetical protein TNCT_588371 [Trichonephila clavata]